MANALGQNPPEGLPGHVETPAKIIKEDNEYQTAFSFDPQKPNDGKETTGLLADGMAENDFPPTSQIHRRVLAILGNAIKRVRVAPTGSLLGSNVKETPSLSAWDCNMSDEPRLQQTDFLTYRTVGSSKELDVSFPPHDDPLADKGFRTVAQVQLSEQIERVRRRCEVEYSSSPVWRARAAKDPNFWKNFSPGGIR